MQRALFIRMHITFGNANEIVGRNFKEMTQGGDIVNAWLAFTAFQIGYFALGHTYSFPKLGLIQVGILPKIFDFFTESQFHFHHQFYYTLDRNGLLTIRQKMSKIQYKDSNI